MTSLLMVPPQKLKEEGQGSGVLGFREKPGNANPPIISDENIPELSDENIPARASLMIHLTMKMTKIAITL
jgi:hypothetical protein